MSKKILFAGAVLVALAPVGAFAQSGGGAAAGATTGAVGGAIVGGPVGAAIGAGVGGVAGGIAEQNAKTQPPAGVVVVPSDTVTTGSVRQRTCVEDGLGNRTCQDVIR